MSSKVKRRCVGATTRVVIVLGAILVGAGSPIVAQKSNEEESPSSAGSRVTALARPA